MKRDYIAMARAITDKYIMLMLFLFPIFTGFEGYANITRSKFLFFVIATSLWLLLLMAFAITGEYKWRAKRHQIMAIVFAGIAIISSILSEYGLATILGLSRYDGLVTTLLYIAIFLGVSEFGQFRKIYLPLMATALCICCVVSVMQLYGSSILFPNDYTYFDAGIMYISKFLGTIGNTNLLAGYICLITPVLASYFIIGKLRYFWVAPACTLAVFVLLASSSAGGTVALIVSAVFASIIFAREGKLGRAFVALAIIAVATIFAWDYLFSNKIAIISIAMPVIFLIIAALFKFAIPEAWQVRITLLTIIFMAICGVSIVYFWQGDSGTVYELSQIMHGNMSDDFGSQRILIWRECLSIVSERPLLGGGADTLAGRIDIIFTRYSEVYEETLTSHVDNAHNIYIAHLVNFGILGLMAYLALIFNTLIVALKSKKIYVTAIIIALVCAWIENFFGLALCLVSPIMWVMWALVYTDEYEKIQKNDASQNEM